MPISRSRSRNRRGSRATICGWSSCRPRSTPPPSRRFSTAARSSTFRAACFRWTSSTDLCRQPRDRGRRRVRGLDRRRALLPAGRGRNPARHRRTADTPEFRSGRDRPAARIARCRRTGPRASPRHVAAANRRGDQHRRNLGDGSAGDRRGRFWPAQDCPLRRRARHRQPRCRTHSGRRRRPARRPGRPIVVRHRLSACGTQRDRLRPHREPEIHRVDLCGPLARRDRLGRRSRARSTGSSVRAGTRWTRRSSCWSGFARSMPAGLRHRRAQVRRLPIHPRLARMLIAADGSREVRTGLRAAVGASLHSRARRVDDVGPAVRD